MHIFAKEKCWCLQCTFVNKKQTFNTCQLSKCKNQQLVATYKNVKMWNMISCKKNLNLGWKPLKQGERRLKTNVCCKVALPTCYQQVFPLQP